MNNKMLTFGICLLLLFIIFISGCITEEKDNEKERIVLKDAPTTLNDTDQNQEIAVIISNIEEGVRWSDWRFQVSKDGNTYYVIGFNTPEPNLKIICRKGIEKNDSVLWEPGETVWFYEDGANYESGTYFYCKIVHVGDMIIDLSVKVY